ncbi:MAG TPA: iron-siderophore ABC transporter substrate-binding protein [Acidimicrobiales bacterium]
MTDSRPTAGPGSRLLALLLALAVAAAACGSGSGDDAGPDARGGAAAAGAHPDAYPVTIEHTYGETTIEEPPERVVTVGLTDHDAVLALGVAPVGVTDWFGDQPHAVWPWAQDELGDAEPEIVGTTEGIDFEQVARLRPDVIIGLYAGLTDDDYETLSQIAPTVAQPVDHPDFGIPWQEQTRTIGRILGQPEEADELVTAIEDRFARARAEHPEFAGRTAVVATPYAGSVSVFAPTDPRGRFLDALGFEPVDEIVDLVGDGFSADLSYEQAELLDVDVLVWIIEDAEADMPQVRSMPIYGELDVVREGREVPVENLSELGGATSFGTVLSLPVLLDQLVPMLAAAVDGDPATPVEQPG